MSFSQTCLNPAYKFNKLKAKVITKDSINSWVAKELAFIQLKKRDTVADIGSFNGYYPLLYSVTTDSIVFYLNDITMDGFVYFDSIKEICTKIRMLKMTNDFVIMQGKKDSTALPSHVFNKVILRDVLHHLTYAEKILKDVKRIMTTNGKLLLFESIKNIEVPNPTLCRGSLTMSDFLALLSKNGFVLTRQSYFENDRYWFEFAAMK